MSSVEEIENRMNQTKNILHKCALEGQINIGLMLSDIEYLINENRTLKNVNEYLQKRLNEKIDKVIIDKIKVREIIQKYYNDYEKEKEYRYTLDVEDEQRILREIEKEILEEEGEKNETTEQTQRNVLKK